MEWNRSEREEEDFNEIKKNITEKPCLANFARDRDNRNSTNMTLTATRESTNENAPPKKFNSDVNSEEFTSEQAQIITLNNTEFNLIEKRGNFYFTNSEMQNISILTIIIGVRTRKRWIL